MLPSPSLGPPLLSASWSPPLCCGMPAGELDAAGTSEAPWPPSVSPSALSCEEEADIAGAGEAAAAGLLLDPPPQPATASAAAASRARSAATGPDLRSDRFELLGLSAVVRGVRMWCPSRS